MRYPLLQEIKFNLAGFDLISESTKYEIAKMINTWKWHGLWAKAGKVLSCWWLLRIGNGNGDSQSARAHQSRIARSRKVTLSCDRCADSTTSYRESCRFSIANGSFIRILVDSWSAFLDSRKLRSRLLYSHLSIFVVVDREQFRLMIPIRARCNRSSSNPHPLNLTWYKLI